MVSLVKKLVLLLLLASPCYGQLLDLTTHAQGGGSQDAVLQGGTTTPTWLALLGCTAITYSTGTHAFACVPAADATHNGYLTSGDWSTFSGKQPAGSYALQATTLTATSPLTGGGDLSTNRAFGCQAASTSQAGCLSAADWNTFNSKQSAGSYVLQSITLTATAPITGGGDLSTNRSFGCTAASTSVAGCLSSTDWNTFNNKQPAGSYLTAAVTSVGLVGTTNQITVTGASPITSTGSWTLSLPSTLAIPSAATASTQAQNNNSTSPATTAYVDLAVANAVSGVNPAVAVLVATTAAGDTSGLTYNNGASGIGATFTGTINTALTIDGVTFSGVGQRLLVKNDTQSPSGAFNGVYYVTQIQTALLAPILTRALDYDQPSDMNNTGAIPVQSGTVNASTSWFLTSQVVTVGTTPLTFAQLTYTPAQNAFKGPYPLNNCVPDASGLVFYTVAALTQWRQGHWEYAFSGFTGTPTLTCTVNFPHVLPTGTAKIILANIASPDGTTAHTMTFKTCDILISTSTQVGSLTCQSTQNFSTTAAAYSTSTLTFGINSTPTADSQMIVQVVATAVSSLAGNVLLGQAYLEFQ